MKFGSLTRYITGVTLFIEKSTMPTTKPRVNVALEKPLFQEIKELAERNGNTLSMQIRDLIYEALDIEEDRVLAKWAGDRARTFHSEKARHHDTVWKHLKNKK